ncbi:hypothetical protein WJ968_17995 [Achromobacter xylosoxidans]
MPLDGRAVQVQLRRLEAGILDLQPGQLRAVAPAHGAERQRRLAGDHLALFHIARAARPRHQPVRFLAHDGLAGRRHQEGGVAVDVEQHARAQAHDPQGLMVNQRGLGPVGLHPAPARHARIQQLAGLDRVARLVLGQPQALDAQAASTRRQAGEKGLVRIAEEHQHAVRADGQDGAQAVIGARGEPGVIRMQVASERPAGAAQRFALERGGGDSECLALAGVHVALALLRGVDAQAARVEHGGGLGRGGEHQWRGGQAGAAQETGQAGMAEQGAQWSSFLLGRAFKHSTRGLGAAWRSGWRRTCSGVSHKPCMGAGARL